MELSAQVNGICKVKWEDEVAQVEVVVSKLVEVDSKSEADVKDKTVGAVQLVSQPGCGTSGSVIAGISKFEFKFCGGHFAMW